MSPTADEVVDALNDVLRASTIQHDPVRAQQMADIAITRARRARRRRLPVMAAVVAAMLAVAGVAAASTGLLGRQAERAFSRGASSGAHGSQDASVAPSPGTGRVLVVGTTPDGGRVELWKARSNGGGMCLAILLGDPGRTEPGKPYDAANQAACSSAADDAPLASGIGERWVSDASGKAYMILAGSAGDAAKVVFRLAGGSSIQTVPQNGFYLTFMPYRAYQHGYAMTALDQTGRVLATQRKPDDTHIPG
jgi:hypothetical protein